MSKKIIFILLFIASTILVSAQNNVRNLADFNALKVSSAFTVELIQGSTNQVEIIGVPEEYLPNLATEITDNMLNIYAKGKIKAEKDMTIKLTFTNLERADISGASVLKNTETLNFNAFELKTSGASNVLLNTKSETFTLKTSGASDVKLNGSTKEFNVLSSGASSIKAKEFEAEKITITESGASDLTVNATKEITGNVSGASSIKVLGNPAINELKFSGASSGTTGENVKINVGSSNVSVQGDDVTITGVANSDINIINDTTKIKLGRMSVLVIGDSISVNRKPKKRRNHWAGIDLGINGFVNNQGSFNLNHDISLEQTSPKKVTQFMELDYAKSWVFSLNFYEHFFKIYQHRFGLVTGLGLEYNNYELKHNVRLIDNGGSYVSNNINSFNENYTWGVVDTNINFSKNRFKTFYINAPLMFEINTGDHKNKSFHLSAGAIFGYKFTTRMKYIYKDNGDEQKVKDNSDFNTNPFKVSLTARVGVGWLNLFATYALTPLFESGRGPELYPFSVGVTLLGF
ncbi:MAG: DUF2807 domain-containing protein [Bacteroidetes bacterium]|nr:DUF2807 domain-containing protein [Bacteroidota bacterium]